jgi:hypothetical protein
MMCSILIWSGLCFTAASFGVFAHVP